MALIKCEKCGNDVSSKAKVCPHCGYNKRLKNNKLIVVVFIIILVMISTIIGAFIGISKYNEKKELERQAQIATLLEQASNEYQNQNFGAVREIYDQLDQLEYDTIRERELLEYDSSVNEVAYCFYKAINDANDTIIKRNASSLNALVKSLEKYFDDFDELDINTDSEIGHYIYQIRNNPMYITFKNEFLHNSEYNMDYGLTKGGYYIVLSVYTEEIVKIPYPYEKSE